MRWTFALKSFPGALPTHNVGIAVSFSGIVLQNTTTASCTPFGLSVLGDDATTGLTWWLKLDGDACFFPTTTKPVRMDVIAWWCCAVSCNFGSATFPIWVACESFSRLLWNANQFMSVFHKFDVSLKILYIPCNLWSFWSKLVRLGQQDEHQSVDQI